MRAGFARVRPSRACVSVSRASVSPLRCLKKEKDTARTHLSLYLNGQAASTSSRPLDTTHSAAVFIPTDRQPSVSVMVLRACGPRLLAVLCAAASRRAGVQAQGFLEWRVASTFEGVLRGLGVQVHASAFGDGFDVERCSLQYEQLYRTMLQPGFDAVLSDREARVRKGVRAIGRALRAFSRSAHRCKQAVAAQRLGQAAEEASTLTSSDVRLDALAADRQTDRQTHQSIATALTILVNDVNVTDALVRAAWLWFRERYDDCGGALAEAVRAVLAGDEEDQLARHDTWRVHAPDGRVRTEGEYAEHLQAAWEGVERQLVEQEREAGARAPALWPQFARPFQDRDEPSGTGADREL